MPGIHTEAAAQAEAPGEDRMDRTAALPATRWPTWPVYASSLGAALLHALPFLRSRLEPADLAWLPVPYIPKDWLAYLAFVREEPRAGQLLLANPFTTDPQDGRFVLLLLHVLNWVHRWTGLDPALLLEVARAALIVAFAIGLWRFLDGFFESDRTRTWAVSLALLSGGLDFVARFAAQWLPPEVASTIGQDLWSMYGWSTYQALFNPLWVAGLTLLVVGLRLVLQPGGPRSVRDIVAAGVTLLALWFTHPYSAIAFVAIVAVALAGEWLVGCAPGWRRVARVAVAVLPALAIAGAVAAWQLGDGVFRGSSGRILGPQLATVSWYPVVFAATGAFALRGWSSWIATRHPWRHAIGGWVVAIALLHSSSVLNGYHFVLYEHLAVVILAAGPIARAFERLAPRGAWGAAGAATLALLLFVGTVMTAGGAVREVASFRIPRDVERLLSSLGRYPPGNVLCNAELGNLVPAFGPHRVYVGHWFMTPDYAARSERARDMFRPDRLDDLRQLVATERIDYVIAPSFAASDVAAALDELQPRIEGHGFLALVRLRGR